MRDPSCAVSLSMRENPLMPSCSGFPQGLINASVGDAFAAVDAARVDAEEDFDAVAGAVGDFGGGDAGVEP